MVLRRQVQLNEEWISGAFKNRRGEVTDNGRQLVAVYVLRGFNGELSWHKAPSRFGRMIILNDLPLLLYSL